MTAIPTGTKFVGISASVPTKERRSALSNGYQDTYTADDLINSGQVTTEVTTYYNQQTMTSGDLIVGGTYQITGYYGAGAQTFASFDGGSGYTTSSGVATTTDGSGSGLTVNITAAGGVINNVVVANPGHGYSPGDTIFISGGNDDAFAVIDLVLPTDDFTNVGAAANASGQIFVATGTTPAQWGASSEITLQAGDVVSTETATVSSLQPLKRVVNITSDQILAMGTTPIELLPAPGAGKYYDVQSIVLEYSFGTTAYTLPLNDDVAVIYGTSYQGHIIRYFITETEDVAFIAIPSSAGTEKSVVTGGVYTASYGIKMNENIVLTFFNGGDPTDGDGTMRAIITYTERTFGA